MVFEVLDDLSSFNRKFFLLYSSSPSASAVPVFLLPLLRAFAPRGKNS